MKISLGLLLKIEVEAFVLRRKHKIYKTGKQEWENGGEKATHTLESENSIATREEEPENDSEGYKGQKFKMRNLCVQDLDSIKVGFGCSEQSEEIVLDL